MMMMATPLLYRLRLVLESSPATVSLTLSARSHSRRPRQCERATEDWAATPRTPAISISVEPSTLAPIRGMPMPPVVFPGYLLPDDDCEELPLMREVDQATGTPLRACARRRPDRAGSSPGPSPTGTTPGTSTISSRQVLAPAPEAKRSSAEAEPPGRVDPTRVAVHDPDARGARPTATGSSRTGGRPRRSARDEHHLKVLLFTSCHRAEGRTTLVLTLARALARRPGRTLLVDGDLTGPMLARQLGLRPLVGLDDVVDHGFALADALIDAPDDHLSILPLRAPVARPRDFVASAGWSCALSRLRRDFDLVLVDGSPLFAGLSTAVLHRSVDAAVLVQNRTLTGERSDPAPRP